MARIEIVPPPPDAPPPPGPAELATSALVEQAFTRASGAPLVKGNTCRLLKDADENYPAWFAALAAAQKSIFFENYIIENDEVGRQLSEVLTERARAGVKVRVMKDYLGSWNPRARGFWRALRHAGVGPVCGLRVHVEPEQPVLVADQPPGGHHQRVLLQQQLPRLPGQEADRLHDEGGQLQHRRR